jgi:thiol-disulfide isomerase/thioredoxin
MTIASCLLALLVTTGTDTRTAPVLLDFGASWCGPCQATRPEVERLKAEGYPVRVIDVDKAAELKARYRVSSIPAFIVVDREGRELARQTGATTAKELARFYNEAKRKWQDEQEADDDDQDEPQEERRGPSGERHNPWETVVRIKVYNHLSRPRPSIGYGSGTIIHSTDDETIILTCAHIFHIEELRQAPAPARFPLKVKVDLFDGRLSGGKTPQVHTAEVDVPAEVIDYDFSGDVGLIRIRPGRRMPYSEVVPPGWTPRENVKLTTLGCSQGHDATAWTTFVTRPTIRLQTQAGVYEGTECAYPPLQGRSGGGLFTLEGVLAGVCDFNDGPKGEHGLYASPKSIHKMLEKHKLQICYAGEAGERARERLLASGRAPRTGSAIALGDSTKLRSQSPDNGELPMPSPEVLGVAVPAAEVASTNRKPRTRPVSRARGSDAWQGRDDTRESERPILGSSLGLDRQDESGNRTAGLRMAPSATGDLFAAAPEDLDSASATTGRTTSASAGGDPWRKK